MQKEPTIKELMHSVGVLALDPESKNNYVDETDWFQYQKKLTNKSKEISKHPIKATMLNSVTTFLFLKA